MNSSATCIPFPEYQALPAVNWSTLRAAATSPLHYRDRLLHPPEETAAMRKGRLIHMAVLEPDRLPLAVAVWEGGTRRGNVYDDWLAQQNGKQIITVAEYEEALVIRDAVRGNRDVRKLLSRGDAECSITWTDAETGLPCKGRIDWLRNRLFADLKTTSKGIDEHSLTNTATYGMWHCQFAFYAMGLAALGMKRTPYVIAVEADEPYDVGVFEIDDDFLYVGEETVRGLLHLVAKCGAEKKWPGQYQGVQKLRGAPWIYKDSEEGELLGMLAGGLK
jgi:hypothetical protein